MFGRPAKRRVGEIGRIRALTQADIDSLEHGARPKTGVVAKFRESHHRVAFLFALGLKYTEIAERTGYSYQRIMQYANDPAFKNLIEDQRLLVDEERKEIGDEIARLGVDTLRIRARQMNDKAHADQEVLDETGEFPPHSIMRGDYVVLADRFGYPKTQVNQNETLDYAKVLAERRKFHALQGTEQKALPAPVGAGEEETPSPPPLPFRR